MKRTLADLLRTEAAALERRAPRGMVYLSFPYSCCLTEAATHAERYQYPPARQLQVERTERETQITIKPAAGSGRRKPTTIRLWV